jgi:hypothetical protein
LALWEAPRCGRSAIVLMTSVARGAGTPMGCLGERDRPMPQQVNDRRFGGMPLLTELGGCWFRRATEMPPLWGWAGALLGSIGGAEGWPGAEKRATKGWCDCYGAYVRSR